MTSAKPASVGATVIDIELGRFYIADVVFQNKLIHVEGVADEQDEHTVTFAPSPTADILTPARVRVYRQQIVRVS